ncbi:MAG: Coq4 family protein [Pseudobdellovibrio sp.]
MELAENNLTIYHKIQNLKGKLQFIKFINNPTDTEGIFKMTQAFQNSATPEMIERVLSSAIKESKMTEDFEIKRWYKVPKMKELAKYPVGTFGYEAAAFFKKNNLDEELFPKADFSSFPAYVTSRVYQTHDFWHILTGYSIDLMDELALQGFAIGQYRQPLSLLIVAGGIIHLIQKQPEKSHEILNSIIEGYARGQQAAFLLDKNIFEWLDKPLDEVRAHFKIVPRGSPIKLAAG